MPRIGSIIESATTAYTILSQLGGGGAGEVFLAEDSAKARSAIKVLRSDTTAWKRKRFHNELMFGMTNEHPNIIRVLDYGLTLDKRPFFVMPLALGTLRSLMQKGVAEESRLPLIIQMLDGTEAAHLKGIFHRDLKPENVLAFGEPVVLQISDFGIAHFEEEALHTAIETSPSERLANFQYAAPEQRTIGTDVDHRADIYALGLIIAEIFTCQVPHGTGAPLIANASPSFAYLDPIVEKMRAQNPSARQQSITEIKLELRRAAALFVEHQLLDQKRKQVVKESSERDALITNPPTLINVSYQGGGQLQFDLSQPVNSNWIQVFQNMPMGGLMGYTPEYHRFNGDKAYLQGTERLAQQLVNQFKEYLEKANELYARAVFEERRKNAAREEALIQNEIRQRETNLRVSQSLKW